MNKARDAARARLEAQARSKTAYGLELAAKDPSLPTWARAVYAAEMDRRSAGLDIWPTHVHTEGQDDGY